MWAVAPSCSPTAGTRAWLADEFANQAFLPLDATGCICMIICMRTTLVLDDKLFQQAKRRAAERNLTLSDIVNEALRESFRGPVRAAAAPFSMVSYGRGRRRVHHEPSDFAETLEDEDRDRLR